MDGLYHFSYGTCIQQRSKLFYFQRIVRNNAEEAVFIDWRGTNIKGYARLKVPLVSDLAAPSPKYVLGTTKLYYGASPKGIETKLLLPEKETKTIQDDIPGFQKKDKENKDGDPPKPISKEKPQEELPKAGSKEKPQGELGYPNLTSRFQTSFPKKDLHTRAIVEFSSDVIEVAGSRGGFLYTYSWQLRSTPEPVQGEFSLAINSKAVMTAAELSPAAGVAQVQLMKRPLGAFLHDPRKPGYKVADVILFRKGTEVAKSQVGVYVPLD